MGADTGVRAPRGGFYIERPGTCKTGHENKKVLLCERKRHTDRSVSSTPSVVLYRGVPLPGGTPPWVSPLSDLAGGKHNLPVVLHTRSAKMTTEGEHTKFMFLGVHGVLGVPPPSTSYWVRY